MSSDNLVETMRHAKVFMASEFGDRRVDVIGCGATGSRIALSLAKLGIRNLHIWDFDKIEAHNIANQAFGNDDIGKFKVEALAETIKRQTGLIATAHNEAVTGRSTLGEHVFLLTDSMKSRKEIWQGALRFKLHVKDMIETRMGADEGRIYAIRPFIPDDAKFWEETLYDDAEASESLCGSPITVGPTAEVISGLAVWQFINMYDHYIRGSGDKPSREIIFGTSASVTGKLPSL